MATHPLPARHAARRRLLQAGAALAGAAVLPAARACEFFTPTLRILHPWTRATEGEGGSALVCMVFDDVREADRLVRVETPVATGAELAGPAFAPGARVNLDIPAGRSTRLSEFGAALRLTGLTQPLMLGSAYPLTLVFAKGGSVNAQLSVDYKADERL